jgi:hypothetical protein
VKSSLRKLYISVGSDACSDGSDIYYRIM